MFRGNFSHTLTPLRLFQGRSLERTKDLVIGPTGHLVRTHRLIRPLAVKNSSPSLAHASVMRAESVDRVAICVVDPADVFKHVATNADIGFLLGHL